MSDHYYRNGVLWAMLCNMLWSTTFVGARHLMANRSIDPVSLSLLRFAIGGALLAAIAWWAYGPKLFKVAFADHLRLVGLAALGITGMSALLFWGQQSTTAINSSMIMQLSPVLILLLGVFIGERITARKAAGIFVSLIGCCLILNVLTLGGLHYDPKGMKGDGLVFLSATCWALYSVWGKAVVGRLGGFVATVWTMLYGCLQLLAIRLAMGPPTLPTATADWTLVLYLAVFPTALAFYAWNEAWARIELSLLNVLQYLVPLFTMLLAVTLLGEKLTALNALGAAAVVWGVLLSGGGKGDVSLSRRFLDWLALLKLRLAKG